MPDSLEIRARLRQKMNGDTEREQALVRVIAIALLGLYLVPVVTSGVVGQHGQLLFGVYVFSIIYSMLMLFWVIARPGVSRARRTVAVVQDYSSMTLAMGFGGEAMVPIYALVLWLTVGNGLRYGGRYLAICTAVALLGIGVATCLNEYWRQHPYMVLTLAGTALLVPLYILRLLNKLRIAYIATQEASLDKSRFLAQASHDLRQPIHAISLFTACLRDGGLGSKELEMVDNIDRSLASVSRLFKSLLDVSILDGGRLVPTMETVHVQDVIQDVVCQNIEASQRAGVRLRVIDCCKAVETDRALLTNMLQNLVSNAIKYCPRSAVLIGCRQRAGGLTIEVHDQGPGIGKEHQGRLFDDFYQIRGRGTADVDGVGLGLSIVRRQARLLGLRVILHSVQGRGTSISIQGLPVSIRRKPPAVPRTALGVATVAGLRVLVIEDDEAVLRATAGLLSNWGCVVQAERGIPSGEASCDLVLADYDLGKGVTGADCIARVRASNGWAVPAVIISGHDQQGIIDDMGDRKIPILAKPVQPAELRSVLLMARLRQEPSVTRAAV